MHMCYERPGVVSTSNTLNGSVSYEKWERERERERGGGGSGAPPGPAAAWGGARDRDRERDRERERQMRAHQMSHPHTAEPDPSPSLFSAPIRIKQKDHVSQQIQNKLGDYNLAQPLLDDPSKSIGIYAEPPSPAPCISSRRDEFKKPSHAPQNGRVHRPYSYNKNEVAGSTGSSTHRPPPLRIPNGHQPQSAIDSSQPPIESILKEMKALPTPLSVMAATPRKEVDNKFIFNPYTNKVQENPALTTSNDLKHPLPKPGLDNRISNSRSSLSPVNKSLALSESDDEGPATTTVVHNKLEPFVSPLGRSSSGSDSSPSDSESESSSAESAPPVPPSAPAPPPARPSWSLSNFAPPPAQPSHPSHHSTYDSAKELRHALADVKPSPPISEMSSDSESASPSPQPRRRRSTAKRTSTSSEDDSHANVNTPSPRTSAPSSGQKRGRPPKPRPAEVPPKKKRGRPPKPKPEPEPSPPPPPAPVQPAPALAHDTKTHIFRKVFTPKKGDEGGGKGGKGGKGKGGKGKGQVTIIEVTAPESGADDDDRLRDERRNEEAIARVSPPPQTIGRRRNSERNDRQERSNERIQDRTNDRIQDRVSIERVDHRRTDDRIPDRQLPERTSNDRLERHERDRIASDRRSDRLSTDRTPNDRLERSSDRLERTERIDRSTERLERIERPSERTERSSDRLERSSERLERSSDRIERPTDRIERPTERIERPTERIERPTERLERPTERIERPTERIERPTERIERPTERVERPTERLERPTERLERPTERIERPPERVDRSSERLERSSDRLERSSDRLDRSSDRLERSSDRLSDRLDRSSMSERSSTSDRSSDRLSDRLSGDKASFEKSVHLSEKLVKQERLSSEKSERVSSDKPKTEKTERFYVRAEADVGSGVKRESSRDRQRVVVRIPLRQLRADTVRALMNPPARTMIKAEPQPVDMEVEVVPTNHERPGESTPIYYSYFERLPADVLSDEERDHTYYLAEAKRIRASAERENEPVAKVMLYLESVLCFVLTGRVLELEQDTKRAFTIYRETIEYIKSIHSMPQRYRAEQHSTSAKLDILSLRVQSLLYLRMFKMYNREVTEYSKIVSEYQQKPALAESVSPLSPTPSPAGSVGSAGSAASASSGYCSLTHPVPSAAHNALLQITKYYTFLAVAVRLWEQADTLCRLRPNIDLFIAADRKCGPLSLFTTFRHLVQYVRYAIQLLKAAPRE